MSTIVTDLMGQVYAQGTPRESDNFQMISDVHLVDMLSILVTADEK
jgi:hypothetical protein